MRGFNEALDRGYSHAITMDADSQHDPNDIQSFNDESYNHDYDIILGYRKFMGRKIPYVHDPQLKKVFFAKSSDPTGSRKWVGE